MRDLYLANDAVGLAELVRSGEVSPTELLETAIGLAEEANASLNAITVWHLEAARATASAAPAGPLAGVPFLLKDLFTPMVGLPSTDGTGLYPPTDYAYDSELTRRFKDAGLVIFGRTASPEFGLTTTTEPRVHGPARNPWSLDHSTGGSSGGAAAMVAAGVVPAAHASDGGGSIRIPASHCGLFGLKPSRSRVSAAPDLGEGWSGMSISHAVTRSVRDSAAFLDVISGAAPGDPYLLAPAPRPFTEEVGADPGSLRVGLLTTPLNEVPVDPDCLEGARAAARLCEDLGHRVEEATVDLAGEVTSIAQPLIGVHTLRLLEDIGALRGSPVGEDEVEPMTWAMAEIGRSVAATDFVRAVDAIHVAGRRLAEVFDRFDVLLSPMSATPPPPIGLMADDPLGAAATVVLRQTLAFGQVMNLTGVPAMSVPLHRTASGLPVGVQFAAPLGGESLLFRLAGQLEAARPWGGPVVTPPQG